MNWKKILIVLLFVGVIGMVAFGLYYLFFRGAVTPEVPPEVNVNEAVSPLPIAPIGAPTGEAPVAPGALELPPGVSEFADGGTTLTTPMTQTPTIGASLSSNGSLNFYSQFDNKFYRMTADGNMEALSNVEFHNVSNATFDQSGNKAIIEYPDRSKIYYNFETGQQVTIPKHWEEFSWDPSGEKIAAKSIGIDISNRFLVTSNPDGSNARAVQELGSNADKVQVNWSPNNQIIATSRTGESFGIGTQEVYFVGQNHENFKSMVVDGLDFRPQWNPNGEQMLYSAASELSDYKPMLWVVDAIGDDIGKNRRSLGVNTWADKCTFGDENTLYCGVPDELPTGAGLQPAVYEEENIPDSLYKIDLNTGLQTKLAVPEGAHQIGKLMITQDKKNLYFTDSVNGVINKIKLEP
jgi:hypothetical protein